MDNRLTENFEIIVDEAKSENHSKRWDQAVKDLQKIHKDLPDVATLAARNLPVAGNNLIALRLANSSIREVHAIGKENLDDTSMELAIRRTHRSVLVQEASAEILNEKLNINNASDFMQLRQATVTGNSPGKIAIAALDKQGIDARRFLSKMSNEELQATSVGAYDRLKPDNKDIVTSALEITLNKENNNEIEKNVPSIRNPRTQFTPAVRLASFGKKIAAAAYMQQQSVSM